MADSKIRIVFKSGHTETFECAQFNVTKRLDKVSEVSWSGDIKPRIMQIDLNEVAAILEVPE